MHQKVNATQNLNEKKHSVPAVRFSKSCKWVAGNHSTNYKMIRIISFNNSGVSKSFELGGHFQSVAKSWRATYG